MIFVASPIFAQTKQTNKNSLDIRSFGMGIQAGLTTGTGLAFKKTFSPKFSLSTAITPPFIQDSRITYSSFGLTGYYNLKNTKHSRFFSYLSVAGFYWETDHCEYSSTTDCVIKPRNKNMINTGIGLGIELLSFFSTDISAQAMLGYGIYSISDKGTFSYPTIELGVYYYLK